jgi:hypothetical protein
LSLDLRAYAPSARWWSSGDSCPRSQAVPFKSHRPIMRLDLPIGVKKRCSVIIDNAERD